MRWLPCGDVADALLDAVERILTADLFDELGPEAPTLLAPCTTRDLAAHLVLREHDRLAAPGLVLPGVWSRFAERRRKALALNDFSALVATIRSGPPPGFFRRQWVRQHPNLNEFFVHHEDVRRADGRGPRDHERVMDEALWSNVSTPRRVGSSPAGCAAPGSRFGGQQPRRPSAPDRGNPTACITGSPGELLLYLFGRREAAQVDIDGTATAVDALRRTRFGM